MIRRARYMWFTAVSRWELLTRVRCSYAPHPWHDIKPDQLGLLNSIFGITSHSEREGYVNRDILAIKSQFAHRLPDALRQLMTALFIAIFQDNGKLLTTVTGGKIHLPNRIGQNLGNRLQNQITKGMAIGVIDPLEVINVTEQHAQWPFLTLGTLQHDIKTMLKSPMIGKPSESVDCGKPVYFLMGASQIYLNRDLGGNQLKDLPPLPTKYPGLPSSHNQSSNGLTILLA